MRVASAHVMIGRCCANSSGDICMTPLIHSRRLQEHVSKSNGGDILKDNGLVDIGSYPEFEMNAVLINPSPLSAASPRR